MSQIQNRGREKASKAPIFFCFWPLLSSEPQTAPQPVCCTGPRLRQLWLVTALHLAPFPALRVPGSKEGGWCNVLSELASAWGYVPGALGQEGGWYDEKEALHTMSPSTGLIIHWLGFVYCHQALTGVFITISFSYFSPFSLLPHPVSIILQFCFILLVFKLASIQCFFGCCFSRQKYSHVWAWA